MVCGLVQSLRHYACPLTVAQAQNAASISDVTMHNAQVDTAPTFVAVTSTLSDSAQNHNTSISQQVTSLAQMQTSIAQEQTTSAQNLSVGTHNVATIAQGRTSTPQNTTSIAQNATSIAQNPQTSDAAALQYRVQNTTSNSSASVATTNPASTSTVTRS